MNDLFPEDGQEHFEERAAIREFDGGQTREDAETAARTEVEEYRFRCMVRQLLKWKAKKEMEAASAWIAKQPLDQQKIWRDACNSQWKSGNRGVDGTWF